MLQEIKRLEIINKAKELGVDNLKDVTMAINVEKILSLPKDYPKKNYPDGWMKKVIENNLFEFQKDLTDAAIHILNMELTGKEDVTKLNKNIINKASIFYDEYKINGYLMKNTYAKKIIEMIIKGEDDEKILNHVRIFSENGCIPKEYKNHEFIAERLNNYNIQNVVPAIEIMDSYTEDEMEILQILMMDNCIKYSVCKFNESEKTLQLIKEKNVELSDDSWKKLLARNWLSSGNYDELVRFFKYYDEEKVFGVDEESYTNILCNYKFENVTIPASLMRYIITHKKNGFLKKVQALQKNEGIYISNGSILNESKLWDIINLNELSEKDIVELERNKMVLNKSIKDVYNICKEHNTSLTPKEYFYFAENESNLNSWKNQVYMKLGLSSDETMIRVKELPDKRGVSGNEITNVVYALREKRFSEWKKEYSRIKNVSKMDVLNILLNKDCLENVLEEIQTVEDLEFVLRNEELSGSLEERKAEYLENSENKQFLSLLNVSKEEANLFISSNSFEIAKTYYHSSNTEQKDNLLKIARAAILGKLDVLKYADLEKEIAYYLSDATKESWKNNTSIECSKYLVGEYTDFKSTMIMGQFPVVTCQSYIYGSYKECLLSNFDANKKIVYVSRNGEYLGRAILRLTKASDSNIENRLSFMDVTQSGETEKEDSELCLFLEKPYIKNGVGGADNIEIRNALKKLAQEKASEMNISLYVNEQYGGERKEKYIFISRSKNGSQYLDSLCGNCGVKNENCFHEAYVCV